MYKNLTNVGLKEYLDVLCGGPMWHEDSWLKKLDIFAGTLSEENLRIVRLKFGVNDTHQQKDDNVNELMIACAYHPTADFIPTQEGRKTSDLFDRSRNLKIEVKFLHEGEDETNRHRSDEFCAFSRPLSGSELERRKTATTTFLGTKKCQELLDKAVSQLEDEGKIYLVYDYNLLSRDNRGTREEPNWTAPVHAPLSGEEVGKVIKNYCTNFLTAYPNVSIEVIYFGDLRKRVANCELA